MSTFIRNWEELANIPNESSTHILEVDMRMGHAHLLCKNPKPIKKKLSYKRQAYYLDHYLSTHTFYGSCYKESEKILHICGFDVKLANWDDPNFNSKED
jgi:hypothetical protein